METPEDMLSRVRLMGRPDTDWDLSDNDTAALRYVLGEAAKYREVTSERDQLRAEVERLRAELAEALTASGVNAKAWRDAVCDEAVKRSQLLAEIGLTEQQRDTATARAEAAEGRADGLYRGLCDAVLASGGVAKEGLSDTFLILGVPAEMAARKKAQEAAERERDEARAHAADLRGALDDLLPPRREHLTEPERRAYAVLDAMIKEATNGR